MLVPVQGIPLVPEIRSLDALHLRILKRPQGAAYLTRLHAAGVPMARLVFGGFELDPISGELWKDGDCIHIQEQPLKLLLCLLERPGELVGRDELQRRMWGGTVHVGFDDSLNAAAWRLRQALGDSAESPLFIETVPKKGYRFVGKVLPLPGHPPPPSGSFPMPVLHPDSGASLLMAARAASPDRRRTLWLGGALALGLAVAGAGLWISLQPQPVTVAIEPLLNGTSDPAVDYFASALSRQVGQDLRALRGTRVVFIPARPPPGGAAPRPSGEQAALILEWTLSRDASGYRIPVRLRDAKGRPRGSEVFLATQDNLHEVHQKITAFVTAKAAREPRVAGR